MIREYNSIISRKNHDLITLGQTLLKHRNQYDEEFKKNAVKLSYASPKTVGEITEDLGIAQGVLYNWRKKYTAKGDKTPNSVNRGRTKIALAGKYGTENGA